MGMVVYQTSKPMRLINVHSSQVIALMNTAPSDQTVTLEMPDVFWDMGHAAQQASWELYDLWAKDAHGKWGKSAGTFTKSVPNVNVGVHGVKVWKAVMKTVKAKRDVSEM
jgi:alpha-galactosidase